MKVFAFRFDIDTAKCLRQGVPPLIDLAERLGVQFTFFLNVGRSVSLPNFIMNKLKPRPHVNTAAALSARQKLGNVDYLYTALLNPRIGDSQPGIVKGLFRSQELGLHGGRNHDLWHHHVHEWSKEQIVGEVQWAMQWLHNQDIQVEGFSAPGWSESVELPAILESLGFRYRADRHGSEENWGKREGRLINLGTNFTGEPGGIAYLEHQRALGRDDKQILADFAQRLERAPDYAVVYDHPYFAGLNELGLIEKMVNLVKQKGYAVQTLGQIAEFCRAREAL